MLFDAHSHLQFPEFDKDRDEVIKRALGQNISLITVGCDKKTSAQAVKLANQYENFYASIGAHPSDAEKEKFDCDFYENLAKNDKVVAIGECGLDYRKQETSNKRQEKIFIEQIRLAIKLNKPLIIHCRDAHKEVINILESYFLNLPAGEAGLKSRPNGVIHFFSGTIKDAEKYLNLGFYLSFSGIITYANQYDELIKLLPADKILAETDSPFAAPITYRGQRNEPIYVKEVVKKLAEIKNLSFEKMSEITFENARKLFRIKA